MIPMIPAAAVAGAVILGLIIYAGYSHMEVQDLRDGAAANTQERLQERLRGEYEGSPTNIQQATILSEWTDDTRIIGILVKCPSGEMHTIDLDATIKGGEALTISSTTYNQMQAMAGRC